MTKRRLLLADDSVTIQKVVNLTFTDEDFEVITVGDGDAAFRAFAEAVPDLVLADVNMPGPDGYQICEQIKQNPATRKIPVVLLVGSFEPFDEEKARRVGADDFLTKPFQSIRQLIAKVSDLLDAKTSDENPSFPSGSAVNSFDDTLKIESSAETIPNADLGDAGMDDAMIQTAQIGSLPVDEAKKFESAPVNKSFADEVSELNSEPHDRDGADELDNDSGWIETQSLSAFDLAAVSAKTDSRQPGENLYEFDGRREFVEESTINGAPPIYPNETKINQPFALSRTSDDLDFEDFDLLDFPSPPKKTETAFENDSSANLQTKPRKHKTPVETFVEPVEDLTAAAPPGNLSEAMIEAIAERVVEKLSNKVIKRLVREVLAQTEKKK